MCKKTTIYVGGTFDCFHIGHVNLFKKAKEIADYVIVALNSDDFTTEFKCKPVMSEIERLGVIRSCKYVDFVFITENYEDQKKYIEIINPDYILHGSDWTGESLVEQLNVSKEFLKEHNIEMKYVPYTIGVSTSEIKKRFMDIGVKLEDGKEGKEKLIIFDFDYTLAVCKSNIYVKCKDGLEKKLNSTEFNQYTLEEGESFDFRDFHERLKDPRIITENFDILLNFLRSNENNRIVILTSRKYGYPVEEFMRSYGINVEVVAVEGPEKKKKWVEEKINDGYDRLFYMDDCKDTAKEMEELKHKYHHIDMEIKLVKKDI